MPLPLVELQVPVEPYAPPLSVTTCDPAPKPGAVAFRDFVLEHLGGGDYGIRRNCGNGAQSEHHEGRAWDWRMDASNPEHRARVEQLFDWLLAPDLVSGEPHANFRRAGLRYMIWDRQIWSAGTKDWRPYTGQNPHTDHVHFSWAWPGARAETSLYGWMAGPSLPGEVPPPQPWWHAAAAVVAGAAVGYWIMVRWA